MDGHFLKKIVLFFICYLINCSFEQALCTAYFGWPLSKFWQKPDHHYILMTLETNGTKVNLYTSIEWKDWEIAIHLLGVLTLT